MHREVKNRLELDGQVVAPVESEEAATLSAALV
jgi:hypothetical protein